MKLRTYLLMFMAILGYQEMEAADFVDAGKIVGDSRTQQPNPAVVTSEKPVTSLGDSHAAANAGAERVEAQKPNNSNVLLETYYPVITLDRGGSTRFGSLFQMGIDHAADCIAYCLNAERAGSQAYAMFADHAPDSIFAAFTGYDTNLENLTLHSSTEFVGEHTGANCFFFCNRYDASGRAIHHFGYVDKYMGSFAPKDHSQIGSDIHRKSVRLLAAVLNHQNPDITSPKNTILYRYVMEQLGSKVANYVEQHQAPAASDSHDVVVAELRKYLCNGVLKIQPGKDYKKLNCDELLAMRLPMVSKK